MAILRELDRDYGRAGSGEFGALADEWEEVLSRLGENDLEKPFSYPWRESRPLRIALAFAANTRY